jgi:hypothetical protein
MSTVRTTKMEQDLLIRGLRQLANGEGAADR